MNQWHRLISVWIGGFFFAMSASGQQLMYRQSFEEPIEQFQEIQWITPGYAVTQSVVSHLPKHGSFSIRGNFNPNVFDPIAKIQGNPFTQLKINFNKIENVKDWYSIAPEIYVSWWFKLDRCDWRGPALNKTETIALSGKFAYLRMNENPGTSYYLVMRGGNRGEAVLSSNGWTHLFQDWYNRASLYLNTEHSYGADGEWHKISALITNDGVQKKIAWWIDDILLGSERFEENSGHHKISNDFIMDSIQFWHSAKNELNESLDYHDGLNYCNGWQIDDFQIWDGVPSRPRPPVAG